MAPVIPMGRGGPLLGGPIQPPMPAAMMGGMVNPARAAMMRAPLPGPAAQMPQQMPAPPVDPLLGGMGMGAPAHPMQQQRHQGRQMRALGHAARFGGVDPMDPNAEYNPHQGRPQPNRRPAQQVAGPSAQGGFDPAELGPEQGPTMPAELLDAPLQGPAGPPPSEPAEPAAPAQPAKPSLPRATVSVARTGFVPTNLRVRRAMPKPVVRVPSKVRKAAPIKMSEKRSKKSSKATAKVLDEFLAEIAGLGDF